MIFDRIACYMYVTDINIRTAAVIYSDELTDTFLSCLAQLHPKLSKTPTILLSFEKRYTVHSIHEMNRVCMGNFMRYVDTS